MRRPPLLLLAMALALSAAALVHAADDLVLSRFGEYLDALARAGRHSRTGGGDRRSDRRDVGGRVRPAGRRPQHRDAARHALSARRHDAGDRRLAGGPVRVGRLAVARRSRSASSRRPAPTPSATIGQLLTHTTAGPNGLTFSYRPDRLAPVAAAIAGCTDSSFRWGVGALLEQMAMTDSVPGADVVQLTAPAEAFTASALQRYAGVAAPAGHAVRRRRPRPRDGVVVRREHADAGVRADFDGPRSRAVRPVAEERAS